MSSAGRNNVIILNFHKRKYKKLFSSTCYMSQSMAQTGHPSIDLIVVCCCFFSVSQNSAAV